MKVLHVSPSFFPAHVYGGATESVYQLCRHIAREECSVRVLTTNANGSDRTLEEDTEREVEIAGGLHVRYCKRRAAHSVSPTLLRLLPSYIRWADLVHLTAVYSFPTIPALLACKILRKPLIWSPRGALQRWPGSTRLPSKAVWEGTCRVLAPRRCVLHVTSEEEARESLQRFPGFKAVVTPNGVEIPDRVSHVPKNGLFRILYLGRLHPKKGIENLLAACKLLNSDAAWSLTIAGAGDPGYGKRIRDRINEMALSQQVKMVGETRGNAKEKLFENADIVTMPSFTENFGMVAAEALARSVPVIAGRNTPWKGMEEIGCGLSVDNDPQSLAGAIVQMMGMPLREMGQRGREWMKREYSWKCRAAQMIQTYEEILLEPRP
ncbi:MAG TPA: glycosyltransferase [Acidobacteriota bacterium]|jgi:glycosyltransferase involved in cell wall biosynthesis